MTGVVGASALFSSRFRENAARALLLPRRRPGQRTPLWQMRQRASQLLSVASRYGSFPIILETYREVLQDVFDLPALRSILGGHRAARDPGRERRDAARLAVRVVPAVRLHRGLHVRGRRATRWSVAPRRSRSTGSSFGSCSGAEELRELLDADALADLELDLQSLSHERAAGSADAVHDLLRRLGDLTTAEVAARVRGADERARERAAGEWLEALVADRRAVEVRIAGEQRWIAAEDVGRYRDGGRGRAAGGACRMRRWRRPMTRWVAARALGADATDRSSRSARRPAGSCPTASSRRRSRR